MSRPDLAPILPRARLSISVSRGFGLTASQLGVLLVPEGHPLVQRCETQWSWFTYFYNALAARAFLALDLAELAAVDDARRDWTAAGSPSATCRRWRPGVTTCVRSAPKVRLPNTWRRSRAMASFGCA